MNDRFYKIIELYVSNEEAYVVNEGNVKSIERITDSFGNIYFIVSFENGDFSEVFDYAEAYYEEAERK